MPGLYDAVDLHWSWNGDYDITAGDLRDTADDGLRSLIQDVHTVCASALKDWENYPGLGATLDDFIGEPNTARTASAIYDRLKISLSSAGVVAEEDLVIKVIPVQANRVLIVIGINAVATEYNALTATSKVVVTFVFDSVEQQLFHLDTPLAQ